MENEQSRDLSEVFAAVFIEQHYETLLRPFSARYIDYTVYVSTNIAAGGKRASFIMRIIARLPDAANMGVDTYRHGFCRDSNQR